MGNPRVGLRCGDNCWPLSDEEEQQVYGRDAEATCAVLQHHVEAELGGGGAAQNEGGAAAVDHSFCDGYVEPGTTVDFVNLEDGCTEVRVEYERGECTFRGECCVIVESSYCFAK